MVVNPVHGAKLHGFQNKSFKGLQNFATGPSLHVGCA